MALKTSTPSSSLYNAGGNVASAESFGASPIIADRDPTTGDIQSEFGFYPIGKMWINSSSKQIFMLISITGSAGEYSATWDNLGIGTADIHYMLGDSGTATPTGGTVTIAGTANQWVTAGAAAAITVSADGTDFIAPGSITSGGDVTATDGNIVRTAAGNKDIHTSIGSGSAAGANSAGVVDLVGGVATVNTTDVDGATYIRLYRQDMNASTAVGSLTVPTKNTGVSFVINAIKLSDASSLETGDASTIFWEFVKEAP